MHQPAWNNNIWGYDTIPDPFHPEEARLYVSNALAFLDEAGEWYLDPEAGKLYYKPAAGVDMAKADENGRASGRERGWQYVWILVVAVTLKKKKTNTNKHTKTT